MAKIAIDIDDTLNQVYLESDKQAKQLAEEFGHQYEYDPLKEFSTNRYQFDSKLNHEWFRRYFPHQVRDSKLMPYAKECLDILAQKNELFIFTAREPKRNDKWQPYKGSDMVRDTYLWVEENGLPIKRENILFNIKNKGLKCKELECSILIDNSKKHINEAIDNGIHAICIGYPYNASIKSDYKRVIRLYSPDYLNQWKQLYDALTRSNKIF